jgi:Ca-activated chloride channel family protein
MFENTKIFYLFLLLPLLVGLFVFFNLNFKKSAKKLAGKNIDSILPYYTEGQKWVSLLFYTFGFILLIIALARPRWGIENISTDLKGRDVLVMIDTSFSMAVPDVVPNRMELAKKYINELLESTTEDRIGLMVFSSDSELLVPVTHDYAAVSFFLESIYPGMIGKGGTDIGNALVAGIKSFDDTDFSNKMIILITDGEDLEGKVKNNEDFIKDSNIRIFTVGIGTKNGEPIPLRNDKGEIESYVKAPNGTHVVSKLDEALLSRIAEITGGSYMRTGGKSGELVEFINRIKNIKSKNFDKTNFTQKKDQYVMFLGIALFLFCLGFVLDLGRFVKRGKLSWITNIFLFTLLFLPSNLQGQTPQVQAMSPQQADTSSDVVPERKSTRHAGRNKNGAWKGNRSFEKNDFPKALSAYASAVYAFSGNQLAKLYLNLANTFVKNQDPQNAGKYYEMALNTASDKELKSRILYQTGLLSFKNRQYTQAAAFFKESLKLNENNDDARYNYAVSVLFAENSQDENQSEDKQDEQEQQNDENKQENENEKKEQEQQQQEKKAENMKDMLEALENKERENSRQNAEAKQSQNQQQQWRGKYW